MASGVGVAVVAVAATLLVCEVALRWIENEPLSRLTLRPFGGAPLFRAAAKLADEVRPLPTPAGVDPAWIDEFPPPVGNRRAVDPELLAVRDAARASGVPEHDAYVIWNRRFLDGEACDPWWGHLRRMPRLLAFDPIEPLPYPRFRHPRAQTTPLGLVTNRFGWRGPDVSLDKPTGVVRIAYVGASTTIGHPGAPFSYPEHVTHWLNRWAAAAGYAVGFEGINAGREGLHSSDSAAIVRQELLPAEPDLVLYYEGANQFLYADRERTQGASAPLPTPPALRRAWQVVADRAANRSALVRRADKLVRVLDMGGGAEPEKPPYVLPWPADLDEASPDPARDDLPLALPTILADLDSIRSTLAESGGELAVASFVWLAYDGLRLDPRTNGGVWLFLNRHTWPYRYSDVRRASDLHNRVLARWSMQRGVAFIDIDAAVPKDPAWFVDAIHFNRDGVRVQAWAAFLGLVPIVEAHLADGRWPRADREPATEHPGLTRPYRYTMQCPRGAATATRADGFRLTGPNGVP